MGLIKFILALLGVFLGIYLLLWVLGFVTTLLWYGFWIALVAGVGYGGYRLFKRAENKYVGSGKASSYLDDNDVELLYDEYEKKYLHK